MSITIGRLIYEVEAQTQKGEASLKRIDGAFQDAQGRWRAANGRFLTDAEKTAAGISNAFNKSGLSLSNFGKTLEKVGTSLTVALTAPLVLIGKKIIDVGFSYEKAMNTFQAVTKASADEMGRAAAMAEKLGADMTLPATSAADAALAMTELAKGGMSASQAMEAARGSLQLAAAAQVDEAKAAEITANALNTFHLAATESVRVSDLLAAASNASSAEITDIALAMQQSGASAAALKIPIEDLATSISLMAQNGIRGSDAGTSLKTAFAALTPSTEKAANAMKSLGIDAFDAKGNFVGLEAVIAQAQPALAKMTVEQRAFAIEAAFGSDAMRAANILLGEGVGKWNAMSGAVNQSGAAAELAAAKTKGLSGAWDGFISVLESAGIQVFKVVSGSLENFVRDAAKAAEGLAKLDLSVIKAGLAFATVAGTAGPLALMIGKLSQLGAQGAIVAGVVAGAGLMAAAYSTNFGQMQSSVDRFFATLMNKSKEGEAATGSFGTAMSKLGVFVGGALDFIMANFERVLVALRTFGSTMEAIVKGNWGQIGTIISDGWGKIGAINESFYNNSIKRSREMEALDRGGTAAHFKLLSELAEKGGSSYASALVNGYKVADATGKIKTITIQEMQGFDGTLRSLGVNAGRELGLGLKQGTYSATHQSPFFIIHWLQDAAKYANNEAPIAFEAGGKKMGEKLKAGFTAALGNINDFLGRAIGGSGTISDSTFDILLRKMPEVASELRDQARAFGEVQKAMELYGVSINTLNGENTKFTKTVGEAINKLLAADAALRSTITPSFANLNNTMSDTIEVTKEMGEAIRKTIGEAVTATLQASQKAMRDHWLEWAKAGEAAKAWGKVMVDAVKRVKEDIKNILGDGIGGALIALAAKFGWHLDKVKGWAGDIVGIVDTLPGKFGDTARGIFSTIQQWAAFADRVLSILHRLDSDIPGSIGGIVEKIAGMFKKTQATATTGMEGISHVIKNASEDWSATLEDMSNGVGDSVSKAMGKAQGAAKTGMAGFIDTIRGGLGFAAGLFGSFMVGNQVAGATGSKTKGAIMGGISGALSGAATGAAWGAAGGPIGAGVGALIGAGAGILGGLLGGGKSKEQKAAEEQAKMKAGLDMQKLAADIMSSQMEGLKKGLELLEGLRTFSEVPRKAILRFFNSIEQIITLFAEMAKKFKADSIEASKTVAELMTGAFESLISGANLIQSIKQVGTVTDQNITDFISTTFTIFQKWSDAADKIEVSTAKFTGKIADKLRTSFEFLNIVPDLLKGITENKGFDASLIDPLFDSVAKIVQKMKSLSEAERGMELNRTGATASILAVIFDTTKSIVEALSLFANYKPLGDGAFSPINGDIVKVTDWMNGLVSTTASWGSLADAALANVNKWADGLGKIASSIKVAIGGASSTSGITANITSQSGALYARGSGGGASSTTNTRSDTYNFYFNFDGSLVSEGEYLAKARSEFTKALKERDDKLKLASVS